MKKLFILFAVMLVKAAVAQNPVEGKWDIAGYLGLEVTSEYVLYRDSVAAMVLDVSADGQFKNHLAYGCGLNCFKNNTGTWAMADATHISFTLTGQKQGGTCEDAQTLPMDLGLYAIIKESDTIIRLIKSDGTAKGDALMRRYSAIANKIDNDVAQNFETQSYTWQDMPHDQPDKIVEHFVAANKTFKGQAKMVFVTSYFFALPVILFEQKGRLYALLYDTVAHKVALYGRAD